MKYEFKPNTIYCGDNLEVLNDFPPECIDLIYIDPPFFSNKNYEQIWGDGYELEAYEDRWKGGIEHYIGWMKPRIQQHYNVLKRTGSFYLHCDYRANALLRKVCDKIFKTENFQNEIIWHYRRWSNASKNFQRMHDTILFYSKGQEKTFNILYQPYSNPEFIETTVRGLINGKVIRLKDENGKYIKRKKENKGVAMHDVWEDINFIAPTSKERLGYPTQKPEALLERIIKASSNEGDIILDGFCGCGTTLTVAKQLRRQFIGIDVSPIGCSVMADRIKYNVSNIINMKYSMVELMKKNWYDLQCWAIKRLGGIPNPKKTSDYGEDGWVYDKGKKYPIEVKKGKIGRPIIQKLESVIRRVCENYNNKIGFIIGSQFSGYSIEEIDRINNIGDVKIIYFTFKELLERDPRKGPEKEVSLMNFIDIPTPIKEKRIQEGKLEKKSGQNNL